MTDEEQLILHNNLAAPSKKNLRETPQALLIFLTFNSSKTIRNSSPPTTKKHKNFNKSNINSITTSHKTKNLNKNSTKLMNSMINSMPHYSPKMLNYKMHIESCKINSRRLLEIEKTKRRLIAWKMD